MPTELVENGLAGFVLPRFSLKHSIRVELVDGGAEALARLNLEGRGRQVFVGPEGDWYLAVGEGEGSQAAKHFETWLTGPVGQNTIAAFSVDGQNPYMPSASKTESQTLAHIVGDAVAGEQLAERNCGRCHMVNEKTRLTTIGSAPSFALLRGFSDWNNRFEAFYALRPHPAFTIIEEVTEPFSDLLPPPIVPMRLTLAEIQAILAFVSRIKPADLGRPLEVQ